MTREVNVSPDLVRHQRRASDPNSSVWVSANAGSGKTHVLTERVLRLMLTGVPPEQILCLTYTKAAAAEMRSRVAKRLGEWTLLEDRALSGKLAELTGGPPDAAVVLRARSLFAHALETPGGLRILTIHAFSESVLHRFPREAGVPFDFTVIEDFERDRLIAAARETVIAEGLAGGGAASPVETLFAMMSDHSINEAIAEALAQQRKLRAVVADVAGAKRRLRKLTGPTSSSSELLRQIVDETEFPQWRWPELFAQVPPDLTKAQRLTFSERLYRLANRPPDPRALLDAFLKNGSEPYKDRCTGKIASVALAEAVGAEHDRLANLVGELRGAELVERSEALLDVLAAIVARYETQKRSRSLLDFDDLIDALAHLLENPELGPWVRYKLDSGIAHILVDESQDTNAEQWRIVDALTEDYFNGDSVERPRTVFAVGDQKQSIFSFQGADPVLFVETGRRYGVLALSAKADFAEVPLKTSFRTLPDILRAVDLTFSGEELRDAILASETFDGHDSARTDKGGMVTLWPPVKDQAEAVDPENWPLTAPASTKSAARRVAERIAAEIKSWIALRRPLGPRGRSVTADDVLVLVQTRGNLFQEVIRALVRAQLPTPGADRLRITSHIGVLDLMALGDVLLNPDDDLQLAALLRSPLFEVSEDDLYRLAQPRASGERLWVALAASAVPAAEEAFDQLSGWRARLDFERPYEFFAEVLYAGGGLKRFHARLGPEIDDVLSEFLDLALAHEQTAQPSLQGFLASLRARDIEIKRELAEGGGGVRVMTVHGAKGLEAPIVILADAASTERGRTGRSVYLAGAPKGPLLFHASSEKTHVAATLTYKELADADQGAEYWRKLYVAMTRAEDELYVTGALTQTGKLDGSWYEAIERALRPEAESVVSDGVETALVYPRQRATAVPAKMMVSRTESTPDRGELSPLPDYRLRRIVRPSSAFIAADANRVIETTAERLSDPRDPEAARKEGIVLHALLQHLSRLDPPQRRAVAAGALSVLLPDSPGRYAALADKAGSILGRPEFATLFGLASRAEVPILAQGRRNGLPVTIAGRIDRLVVEPGRVMIVDFKSDAVAPDVVPAAYLAQLGLYALVAGLLFPRHEVAAAILWTGPESLTNLPLEALRYAVSDFTIG